MENIWGMVDGPFSYVTLLLSCAVPQPLIVLINRNENTI